MPICIPQRMPWTSQPQVPVGIDWGNPLTDSLVFLCNGAFPNVNIARSPATTISGAPNRRQTIKGSSADFSGSQDYRWNYSAVGSSPKEVTLFAYVLSDNNAVDEPTVICLSYSGSNNELIRIQQRTSGGGLSLQSRDWVASNLLVVNSNYPVVNGEMVFVVARWRENTGEKAIFINGIKKNSSTTNTGTQANLNQTEIGVMVRSGAAQWWDGAIPLSGIYSRALSDKEIFDLSQNPRQLFAP